MHLAQYSFGSSTLHLAKSDAEALESLHLSARVAHSDYLSAEKSMSAAESDMVATLRGLYRLTSGDLSDMVVTKAPDTVAQWFGMDSCDKSTASEWVAAAVAIVEWNAPDSVAQSGRKALVEWKRGLDAVARERATEVEKSGVPSKVAKVVARDETRKGIATVSVAESDHAEVAVATTIRDAFPDSESAQARLNATDKRRKARKDKAPASSEGGDPVPVTRADAIATAVDAIGSMHAIDMAEGRGRASWDALIVSLVATLGWSEVAALGKVATATAKSAKGG
jgi:hypothetical protein